MIWINIQGLPLCAWGSAALKRVASSFGKFMFFKLDHSDNMSIRSLCIDTKHKQLIDEEVSVLINGENFIVHVYEVSNWSVKIEDYLESKDGMSDNEQVQSHSGYEASTKHEMKTSNVMDEPDDVTDSEKEINETKEEEIPQKHNHFDCNSTPSDDSCPPGFEFLKGQTTFKPHGSESHKTSHYSTSFAKYREKDFKGTSLLHEINHVIEVGGALGYDMNKLGTKMIKLDRFLLSKEVLDDNHNLKVIVLDRLWSDHSPILLHTLKTDYGPISFKFFHSRFRQKDIDVVVKQAFVDTPQSATGGDKPSKAKSNELERRISSDEIRKAMWDCGSDKAPGPDGFTFQFLKRYWDLFKDDIELFVSDFFSTARLPPGTNSSFITLIPKNQVDMDNIIRLLNVFYLASGLRININKSNVYGIGVSNNDIKGLYRLETHPNCSVSDRFSSVEWAWHWSRPITSGICIDMIHSLKAELHSLSLSTDRDALRWGLTHDGSFTVGATRKHIDDVILPTLSVETSSCNILPRKVNILIWRIRLGSYIV
uniref:RNA-directed DNA polymerase, eukaryota n=1 Tax=Tanacetum cinerariifolium TaxID=118510 RepID=A0A6L2N8B0_TANCI|nr:hypothetical protein [Tanacetum cinerariifolium]